MYFSRYDLKHLIKVIKLARKHGHKHCGYCANFLAKFEKRLAARSNISEFNDKTTSCKETNKKYCNIEKLKIKPTKVKENKNLKRRFCFKWLREVNEEEAEKLRLREVIL